jgi:hypothetical protein
MLASSWKQLCGWKYIQILTDDNGPSYKLQKLGSFAQALGFLTQLGVQ